MQLCHFLSDLACDTLRDCWLITTMFQRCWNSALNPSSCTTSRDEARNTTDVAKRHIAAIDHERTTSTCILVLSPVATRSLFCTSPFLSMGPMGNSALQGGCCLYACVCVCLSLSLLMNSHFMQTNLCYTSAFPCNAFFTAVVALAFVLQWNQEALVNSLCLKLNRAASRFSVTLRSWSVQLRACTAFALRSHACLRRLVGVVFAL